MLSEFQEKINHRHFVYKMLPSGDGYVVIVFENNSSLCHSIFQGTLAHCRNTVREPEALAEVERCSAERKRNNEANQN